MIFTFYRFKLNMEFHLLKQILVQTKDFINNFFGVNKPDLSLKTNPDPALSEENKNNLSIKQRRFKDRESQTES